MPLLPTRGRFSTHAHLFPQECSQDTIRCYSETLRKAIKSNAAGPYIMKAIKCWIQDPSKPPTVKIGILSAQNDVHRAIETQTEIGWLYMFCGFVSIDWGHVNMEADLVPNPSKNMHAYLNQIQKAIKSRPSPDAWCVSANAYVKTVIQALQDYG